MAADELQLVHLAEELDAFQELIYRVAREPEPLVREKAAVIMVKRLGELAQILRTASSTQ